MIFAAIELLIYCGSLAGLLALGPVALWMIGVNGPESLLAVTLIAPFLVWGLGCLHWRGFELARPYIYAGMYAGASAMLQLEMRIVAALKRRRELHVSSTPWAKVSLSVGKILG